MANTNTTDLASPLATATTPGLVTFSDIATLNTGIDTTKVSPVNVVSGSIYGRKNIVLHIADSATSLTIANGTVGVPIPSDLAGWIVKIVRSRMATAGSGAGTTDFQLRIIAPGGVNRDVLSTKITASAQDNVADGIINASNATLATGDLLFADVDALEAVAPTGGDLIVTIEQAP